jgi:hypothetical protein
MNEHQQIAALLDEYCAGLFNGDVARLRAVFRKDAVLFGRVKQQPYYKQIDEYLCVVQGRASPAARGETFAMRTVSIEVCGPIARAVVRCPMLGFDYLDYLSLLHDGERWEIASKLFTHVEGQTAAPNPP